MVAKSHINAMRPALLGRTTNISDQSTAANGSKLVLCWSWIQAHMQIVPWRLVTQDYTPLGLLARAACKAPTHSMILTGACECDTLMHQIRAHFRAIWSLSYPPSIVVLSS